MEKDFYKYKNPPMGVVPSAQRGWAPSVQVGLQPLLELGSRNKIVVIHLMLC